MFIISKTIVNSEYKTNSYLYIFIYHKNLKIFRTTELQKIFLSLRVFGQLSSSLLLFPQRFGRYVLRSSSGVCRTREPSQKFELRPLLNPQGVACSDSVSHNRVQVFSIPVVLLTWGQDWTCNLQMIVSLRYVSCWSIQSEFLGLINFMFLLD